MAECKRMKEDGTQSGLVTKDVKSKWNSMSDAKKEPYITQSRNDSKEYKERRKAHENKEVSTRCSIKRVNSLIKHLKEKGQLNVLGEIGFGSLVGVRDRPIRRELCRSLMAKFDVRQCIAKYGDFSFPLGIPCAAAVLGVENEGKSVVEICKSKDWKALAFKYGLKQKGSQRYLKGCIAILEVALFDFWSGCEVVPAYEITGVARIRAWGKEEVVRVIVKLKLDRANKHERGDDGEGKQSNFDILMSELPDIKKIQFYIMQRQSRVEEKLDRVEDTLERHKGVVEGKIDGVVKEVEGVVKEVVELRSELTGVKGVVDKYLDEGDQLKGEIKEMKSYVEKQYDELKKYEEEKREEKEEEMEKKWEEEEEEMEEMRRKEVDVIYTTESVMAADLDSECPAPQKKKQKVEKADIPSGIDDIEAAICDYLWNSELESGYSVISMGNQFATVYDVATLKPTEWVGGVVIDLLAWTVCYDSQKSLRRIGNLPYHLAHQALDANRKESVESIVTFWGPILDNYMKFTDYRVATIYDSMFTFEASKQRVKDAKRLVVREWDRSRILNDLHPTKMAPKRQRQKRDLSQSSSQPQPPSETNDSSKEIRSFETLNFRSDMEKQRWQTSFKVRKIRPERVIDLDQEREEMDPIGHEEEQPIGDAMMEEAPEALVAEDVTIKTVMEYMVNFREHIDSLVSGMRADISSLRDEVSMLHDELCQRHQTSVDNQAFNEDEADDEDDDEYDDDDDDDDDDPNNYIVSAMPPSRKLVIFDLNGVLAYIPRLPADVVLRTGLFEFMQFCVDNFVVALWSSKMRHNVDRVLEKLPLFSEHFLYVWDQAKCKTYDNVTYCKDLNDVWNACPDFNELNTLLVDDSAEKMIYNPKYNYICPHTFHAASHSNDNALEKGGNIREYLENLLNAHNVPDFVRNNHFSSD
ncbi:hypothetical protein F3Y22_tig00110009pilonHSYRG00070 [Hibiscus syriacus]|uniref:FCP1 homology domain-containing protein n=1 Tax=Hibiscus syriacus TaxID=106335 RepID=A0A6A3BPR1_HIBSY|nr:hypothetical protein F3Y22_tig00110009pilonHSYRG00070 [Hibiscus syriacus]